MLQSPILTSRAILWGETTQDGHEEFRDSLGPGAFQDSQEAGDEGSRPLNVEGLVDEQKF